MSTRTSKISTKRTLGASRRKELVPPETDEGSLKPTPYLVAPWLAICFLVAMVAYEAWYLTPSLFRAWYFSSDEYVMVAEVIRFLHLDFDQHFFDMPGTPLMILTAIIWLPTYAVGSAFGFSPSGAGLEHFTFDHLSLLFTLMRGETLFFALCSIVLIFFLASRLTNPAGGCVAALFLMMSPTYTSYSSFIRVESLSMCLILGSIFCMLRALRDSRTSPGGVPAEGRWILLSGLLAGLAAATRLHSITASLPLLLLLLFMDEKPLPQYPGSLSRAWKYTLRFTFASACAGAIAVKTGYLPNSPWGQLLITIWPKAFGTLYAFALFVAALAAALLLVHRIPGMRWFADRVQHPRILLLAMGCCVGCLVGTPTILWQPGYFFQSINSYSTTYFDLDRANWPLLQNIAWYLKFYLNLIAPDYLTMALLAIGATLILVQRDRRMLPFLLGAVLFFASKPIKLVAAPHHIILWLPFFGMIAGYALAWPLDKLPERIPYAAALKTATFAGLFVILALGMSRGPQIAAANAASTEGRLQNVALATEWIHKNTEPGAIVAVSYFCFNPDIFFTWLRALEVPAPSYVWDGRKYLIWWGEQSALRQTSGYACAAPEDLQAIKQTLDLRQPGEGTNPFTDKRFRLVKSFGKESDEMDVFRFDFRDSPAPN
jgi:dolichyl-phosphate-mannose-protein mannosyltransferase